MDKLTLATIKQQNLSEIYRFLYEHDHSPKTAISKELNISMPTVSQHLNTLLTEGLITKSGQLSSSIGRRATAYSVVENARISIGVEILEKRVTISAVNLKGNLIKYERALLTFSNTEKYYKDVCDAILLFIDRNGFEKTQILGVGIALQGLSSSDHKSIKWSKILPLDSIDVTQLEKLLGYTVYLFHDAEAAAENAIWHKPEIQNAIYVSLSAHLGGAIIFDGKIQTGNVGKSGVFEHMILYPNGKRCYCGKYGCAEAYCSGDVLLQGEELETFFEALRSGDAEHAKRWDRYLKELSLLFNNIHMVVDEPIFLGGHMSSYLENSDFDTLHRYINERTAFPENDSYVFPGSRMNHEVAIGAGIGFIRDFLSEI